jgi:DNA-binding transcriptional LysR family regulator
MCAIAVGLVDYWIDRFSLYDTSAVDLFPGFAEHGSFSAAAESLHMAQPSMSEQIRRLEAELGVPLSRARGGVWS